MRSGWITTGPKVKRFEEEFAAYVGCAPLRDLPDDLYQTPKGGWAHLSMYYKLP